MRATHVLTRLAKGEPISLEERIAEVEKKVDFRLRQIEDSLMVFRDILMKMYEEREELREENSRLRKLLGGIKAGAEEVVFKPIMETGKTIAEGILEIKPDNNVDETTAIPKEKNFHMYDESKETDTTYDRERMKTVQWMRQKFGLPPQPTKRRGRPKVL